MKNHKHLYEPDSALMYSVMITELYQFRVGLGTRIRLPFRWVSCRRCRKFPICVQHQSAWFCRGGSRNTNWEKFQNLRFPHLSHMISAYLEKSGGVKSDTGSLSDNFGREAQIIQDSIVNRSQSSAEWSLLLLVFGLTGWFWQDSSLK